MPPRIIDSDRRNLINRRDASLSTQQHIRAKKLPKLPHTETPVLAHATILQPPSTPAAVSISLHPSVSNAKAVDNRAYSCPINQPQIRACRTWQHLQELTLTLPTPLDPGTLGTIIAHIPRVLPSNFRSAVTKFGQPLRMFMVSLLDQLLPIIPELAPRDAALVLWSLAKIAYPVPPHIVTALLLHAQELFPRSTGQDLATYAWAASRLQPYTLPKSFLLSLEAATFTPRRKANGHDLAMLIWALGSLRYQPSEAWLHNTCQAINSKLDTMSGQNLSNILWGLASMPVRPPTQWVQHILGAAVVQLHAMTNQNLVNILWALARMGYRSDDGFVDVLLVVAYERLPIFNPQDLANTIWALATLKHRPSQEWLERFMAATMARSSKFLPVQLANIMWGVSELGFRPSQKWVETQVVAATVHRSVMRPRWVADVLGALVLFDARLPDLIEDLLGQALHQMSRSEVPTMKRIVRHLAALQFQPSTRWMDNFVQDLTAQTHRMDPDQICVVIWTLAKLQRRPRGTVLDEFLYEMSDHTLEQCSEHQLYRLVLGLARLGVAAPPEVWSIMSERVQDVEGKLEETQHQRVVSALHHIRPSRS